MTEIICVTLFKISLIAAIMASVIFCLRALVGPYIRVGFLSFLWLMVLARLMIPITIDVPFHFGISLGERTGQTEISMEDRVAGSTEVEHEPIAYSPDVNDAMISNSEATATSVETQNNVDVQRILNTYMFQILFGVWLMGAAMFFSITWMRMWRFGKQMKIGYLFEKQWLMDVVLNYKRWLGIKRHIRVAESEMVDVPVVMGWIHPTIILPEGLAGELDQSKLKVVILHELCHVKRCDLLKNYLWMLAKGIHWFNPLVWSAYKTYLEDAEQACDLMVIKALNDEGVIIYSEALVAVMRQVKKRREIPVFVSFCKNGSTLRKRVTNMLKPKKKPIALSVLVIALLMILSVGCFTTACMQDVNDSNMEDENEILSVVQVSEEDLAVSEQIEKSIYIDRVETEARAIEIARQANISNADQFVYDGFYEGMMDTHLVKADDGTNTSYMIYDINGEIERMQTDANIDNAPIEITENEARLRAQEIATQYYGDVTLTIEVCEESQGVLYRVFGDLYKDSEGSTREFNLELSGSGQLIYVSAVYDYIYSLDIADEMVEKALSYGEEENETVYLVSMNENNGYTEYAFRLEKSNYYVTLNGDDYSLIQLDRNLDVFKGSYDKTQEETEQIALDYIMQYVPKAENIALDAYYSEQGFAEVSGTLEKLGSHYKVCAAISNEGDLWYIDVMLNMDYESMDILDVNLLEQKAREIVASECPFIKADDLVLDTSYESTSENTLNQYMFNFEYKSDSPSVTDYGFVAETGVNKYTGDFGTVRITPTLDGLNVLSEKELIEKAKQYIVEEYNVNEDKLVYIETYVLSGRTLEYQVNFSYGDIFTYGCSMVADTGERDGVGIGSNAAYVGNGGYDVVARLTGDYFDREITYYNKTAEESYTFVVDNPFCWIMDSVPWVETETMSVKNNSIGYSEYIDILDCHIVKSDTGLVLYYDDMAYIIQTTSSVFDDMVNMIKGEYP